MRLLLPDLASVPFVVWVECGDAAPERLAMVHFKQMAKLVDEYVIDELVGKFHESDIEADRPTT